MVCLSLGVDGGWDCWSPYLIVASVAVFVLSWVIVEDIFFLFDIGFAVIWNCENPHCTTLKTVTKIALPDLTASSSGSFFWLKHAAVAYGSDLLMTSKMFIGNIRVNGKEISDERDRSSPDGASTVRLQNKCHGSEQSRSDQVIFHIPMTRPRPTKLQLWAQSIMHYSQPVDEKIGTTTWCPPKNSRNFIWLRVVCSYYDR